MNKWGGGVKKCFLNVNNYFDKKATRYYTLYIECVNFNSIKKVNRKM